ncbi:glycosyltransferase family 2 protein [Butyrivibrio proteoclasticus]|uniref:glycosyltransferase family 2 protein n=1 Tax=Butyrivibrio proteoclasticus TaxID=43305 RepID=UPI000479375C|nr:glycosyltransferase family 2 protein [Butyrivibrio proteoclasticus]
MIFTVVIPVYNAVNYIENLVENLVGISDACGKHPEVKTLLIENGSDDGSYELCDKLAEKYAEVSCAHFGKIGAFRARREGMKRVKGDYAFFLDADDGVSPDLVKEVQAIIDACAGESLADKEVSSLTGTLKNKLPDIIQYNAADYNNRDKKMFAYPFEAGKLYSGEDKKLFYQVMCEGDSINALWNKCISVSLIKKALEDESLNGLSISHGEDLLQTAQLLDLADSVVYLDKILYYYRVNPNGLTAGFHADLLDEQIVAWDRFDGYVDKWFPEGAALVKERKSLTCSIAIRNLIYSGIGYAQKKVILKDILDSDFYGKYGKGKLPSWAPEADVFVHDLELEDKPYNKLLASARKNDFKSKIKHLIQA